MQVKEEWRAGGDKAPGDSHLVNTARIPHPSNSKSPRCVCVSIFSWGGFGNRQVDGNNQGERFPPVQLAPQPAAVGAFPLSGRLGSYEVASQPQTEAEPSQPLERAHQGRVKCCTERAGGPAPKLMPQTNL